MPDQKPTTTSQKLRASYADLARSGTTVTVRALRDHAGVSTQAASDWLKGHRADPADPEVPLTVLQALAAPLWSAALAEARSSTAEAVDDEVMQRIAAETTLLEQVEHEASRADTADATIAELTTELTNLKAQLAEAQAQAEAALRDRDDAVRRAEAADRAAETARVTAADATATARTLREILNDLTSKQATPETPASSDTP